MLFFRSQYPPEKVRLEALPLLLYDNLQRTSIRWPVSFFRDSMLAQEQRRVVLCEPARLLNSKRFQLLLEDFRLGMFAPRRQ